jgi:hypothetical protein
VANIKNYIIFLLLMERKGAGITQSVYPGALSGVKEAGHETDYSSPSSAEVKNA